MMTEHGFNQHGGLTIMGLNGYEPYIDEIKHLIQSKSDQGKMPYTPVDVVRPEILRFPSGEADPRMG
jgi:hypothetical protein